MLKRFAFVLCVVGSFFSPLYAQDVTPEYVVQPGDVLRIVVWPDSSLGGRFPVELSGSAYLPLLGEFTAAGRPLTILQRELRQAYAGIMNQPAVSITAEFPVGILGGVDRPGRYLVEPTWSVMDVITQAGGFTDRAQEREVRVLRGERSLPFNAEAALATGQDATIVLQSGDRIVVPERNPFNWGVVLSALQLAGTLILIVNQVGS